tara:strand:- start:465 stop:884 length:420 start_codon:yes stop_codon:yes gene_type:complete
MGDRDAEAREAVAHEREGAAIERLVGDDLVAGLEQRPHRGRNRPHAGRGAQARFSPLKAGDAGFEQRNGGIGNARIDVALGFAGKQGAALLGRLEGECGGKVQRRGQRVGIVFRIVTVMDGAGGKAKRARGIIGHGHIS